MAAHYNIYPEHNLIFIRVEGKEDMPAFGRYVFAILEDPRCQPGMNTLLDCAGATVQPRAVEEERSYNRFVDQLTANDNEAPERRVAVVAGENLAAFGVSRMREVPLAGTQIHMRVFNGGDEALTWLGLDADLASQLTADQEVPTSSIG